MADADGSLRARDALLADRLAGSAHQVATSKPSVAAGWDQPADLTKDPAEVPQLADTPVPADLRAEIEGCMAQYPERRSAVIPALRAAQRVHGWCSPEAMRQVGAVMAVTPAYLSSIASFYDMLHEEPVGRHAIYVCTSVACHLSDAKRVYDAIAEAGADLADTVIREFECLGACDMAPMASVDGRYIGPLDESDAEEIIAAVREGRKPLPGRGLEDSLTEPGRHAREGRHVPERSER